MARGNVIAALDIAGSERSKMCFSIDVAVTRLGVARRGIWLMVGVREFLLLRNVQNSSAWHRGCCSVGAGSSSWRLISI